MVPPGIEPGTHGFSVHCSTTELGDHRLIASAKLGVFFVSAKCFGIFFEKTLFLDVFSSKIGSKATEICNNFIPELIEPALIVVDDVEQCLPHGFECVAVDAVHCVVCGVPSIEESLLSHVDDVDAWYSCVVDGNVVVGHAA